LPVIAPVVIGIGAPDIPPSALALASAPVLPSVVPEVEPPDGEAVTGPHPATPTSTHVTALYITFQTCHARDSWQSEFSPPRIESPARPGHRRERARVLEERDPDRDQNAFMKLDARRETLLELISAVAQPFVSISSAMPSPEFSSPRSRPVV
jgi:hypothetical protein